MKNTIQKGQYGYRNYHKKIQCLLVMAGVLMIVLQLLARGLTKDPAVKNILTVMAVLSVLPTANVASPFLASWRFRTPPAAFYDKVSQYEDKFIILYDLILTTKEAIMPMDGMIVHPQGIYAYCSLEKVDEERAQQALNQILKNSKLDLTIKIFKDENSFYHRLEGLKPAASFPDDKSTGYAENLLKSLSM